MSTPEGSNLQPRPEPLDARTSLSASNGATPGPQFEHSLASIDALLTGHRPATAPIDPEFARRLGDRFVRMAAAAEERYLEASAEATDGEGATLSNQRGVRAFLADLANLAGRRPLSPLRLGGMALVAVALAGGTLFSVSRTSSGLPPAIDRAELVALNAEAWDELGGLTGAFTTGDGWYFEEWISRQAGGDLRFKRFIRPPDRTPNRAQWNVSDGKTEWVVDAATQVVRFSRPAIPGDFTMVAPNDALQCTALALPDTISDGPAPLPVLVGDRRAYRLDGSMPDGSPAVYWLDADDHLVFRIDRAGVGTVWRRIELAINPSLPAHLFHPGSLTNL